MESGGVRKRTAGEEGKGPMPSSPLLTRPPVKREKLQGQGQLSIAEKDEGEPGRMSVIIDLSNVLQV